MQENNMGESIKYDGKAIVEWNIDGQTEYQIVNTVRQMMFPSASKLNYNSNREIAEAIVAGFIRQLQGWWNFHLATKLKNKSLELRA